MKKFLILLFLMMIGTSVYAQKRYIHIRSYAQYGINGGYSHGIQLSGYVPSDMKNSYKDTPAGDIINKLAQKGYVVEQLSNAGLTHNIDRDDARIGYYNEVIIMSISPTPSSNKIECDVNKDGEVDIEDINIIVPIILDIVRNNPSILEQYGIKKPE